MPEPFETAKDLFFEGVHCFEAGRYLDAEAKFQASLALLPGRVSTLNNLAATQIKLARPQAALDALEHVLAAEPGNAEAWCQRGIALCDLARHDEALACFDKSLALDGGNPLAWYLLGDTLFILRRRADALRAFERLLQLQPDRADAWFRHGQSLQALDRHGEALASYDKALALDPRHAQAWSNRGGILKDLKRFDEAAASFEKALALGANAEVDGFFLASLRGQQAPASAPRPYVESLFDEYADQFEDHLVGVLRYGAHRTLVDLLQGLTRRRFTSALDLGCGTGLCAPLVKSFAARIDGVDLSRRMLDKAHALGLYDRLVQADVVEHLRSSDRRYDLVLSADVLPYIGDLQPLFSGVRRVIDAGGVFCFSAEAAGDTNAFELLPSLRYAHAERYLRELAAQQRFEVLQIAQHPIREDQRRPIPGWYVFLSAPTG